MFANVIQLVTVADKYTKTFGLSLSITITIATFSLSRKPLLLQTAVVGCIIVSLTFFRIQYLQ